MCLILFAFQSHPIFPFIVVANRDEFYDRPTQPASFWEDHPTVLAGRDLKAQGTWMGTSTFGNVAALTNYRDPKEDRNRPYSRGEIVSNFLKNHVSSETYIKTLRKNKNLYNGYNVLLYDQNQLMYYSNISNTYKRLSPGIYGLSNHFLDTPWPKVKKGKEKLKMCLNKKDLERECLFELLADKDIVSDHELPQTGVSLEWERLLSPLFISSEDYGTRTSTVMTMDLYGEVNFIERTFENGKSVDRSFTIKKG